MQRISQITQMSQCALQPVEDFFGLHIIWRIGSRAANNHEPGIYRYTCLNISRICLHKKGSTEIIGDS
jgi:hypothetical protein